MNRNFLIVDLKEHYFKQQYAILSKILPGRVDFFLLLISLNSQSAPLFSIFLPLFLITPQQLILHFSISRTQQILIPLVFYLIILFIFYQFNFFYFFQLLISFQFFFFLSLQKVEQLYFLLQQLIYLVFLLANLLLSSILRFVYQ